MNEGQESKHNIQIFRIFLIESEIYQANSGYEFLIFFIPQSPIRNLQFSKSQPEIVPLFISFEPYPAAMSGHDHFAEKEPQALGIL
jgi:hypothetical protein